mmetsp:Transcript_10039/g.28327  ORF Transcript_10039/g.28327 Transcript_10039/m.28327 type:complete len:299 (+) Transcript_10039:2087-2983(+)
MVAKRDTVQRLQMLLQVRANPVHFRLGVAVERGRRRVRTLELLNQEVQVCAQASLCPDLDAQVGPSEGTDDPCRVLPEPQAPRDVLPHLGRCRGCERQDGHLRQALADQAQLLVVRPEVVAPLGDTVGLIDRDQPQPDGVIHPLQKVYAAKLDRLFGRQVDEGDPALRRPWLHAPVVLAAAEEGGGGVALLHQALLDQSGPHCLVQLDDLVLHQGHQRRDHNHRFTHAQPRKLEAHRLAGTCRHHHQGVSLVQGRLNGVFLAAAEVFVPEELLEGLFGVHALPSCWTSDIRLEEVPKD